MDCAEVGRTRRRRTLGGFAPLWAAIAADMGVSLIVIANALRLLREGPA
jgi:cation transport ATPase